MRLFSLLLCLIFLSAKAQPLKIASLSLPPFSYMENGEIKGFAVEIVSEALNRLEVEHKIFIQPWARSLREMQVGSIDGLFPMFKTPERLVYANFPQLPVVYENVVMVTRHDSGILFEGDLASLGEYRICRVRGYSSGKAFDTAVLNGQLPNIELVNTSLLNLKKLLRKRCQILVDNDSVIFYQLKSLKKPANTLELLHTLERIPSFLGLSKYGSAQAVAPQLSTTLQAMYDEGS
ncbi:substrate-binding periplasmic protein [Dongshaea marina]|uniref:substrate-binding periplasmic protein n=1 Tax=Dongshaea marina TaxID=2047966 RepID=UPI000D3E33C6|nr:transporter substrate-binding domain-containing protein [Dongshaea marina]